MHKLYKIFILIIGLQILCFAQDRMPPQNEKFDPLTLNEPFLPIANGTMIRKIVTGVQKTRTRKDTLRYVEQMGWKVQVLSIKDGVVADSVLREMEKTFGKANAQLIWNSPYWKIRVGNCTTRREAERLLTRIKGMGYRRAWIISSKIRIKEKQIPFKD